MRIFVTGASGFIGRHVVRTLGVAGIRIRALGRTAACLRNTTEKNLEVLEGDLASTTVKQLAGCQSVVHLAAHGVVDAGNDWAACFQTNVTDSLRLWQNAIAAGVKHIVICGSCFEYGRSGERYDFIPIDAPLEPTGAYHASKAAASIAAIGQALSTDTKFTIVRPFHVFGEGENQRRLWPSLRGAAASGADFPMTLGEQVRDFVPVENVARVFAGLATSDWTRRNSYHIIHVGSGKPVSVREFCEEWWRRWNARGRLLIGALPYRPNEVMRYVPKISD